MEAALKNEYELVQKEITDVRSCITTYVNMFFTVGTGIVALFTYLATKDINTANAKPVLPLSQEDWAYISTGTILHQSIVHLDSIS